jgi:hypothetical protein
MKKQLRVFVSHAGKFSDEAIPKGTVIHIAEADVLLPANRNRILAVNWDLAVTEHIVPRETVQAKTAPTNPPKLAEFLLIAFATTRHAAHAVGDRNEVFARECGEFGRDRAVRRYWADTLRSLRPLLRRAIGKVLKWGAVIAAVRRLF